MAIAPGNRSFTSFIQLHSTGTYAPHAQVAIHALHFYRFFIFTGKSAKNPVMNAYINAGILIWFITHINRWKGKQCEQILDIWCMYNSLWKVQKKTERLFLFKCKKIWQDVKTAWRTIFLVAEKEQNKLDYKELIQTRMFSHVNTDVTHKDTQSLTNLLSEGSDQLIKWVKAGVLLPVWKKKLQPHGPLRNSWDS